jgi:RNA polymerase sigma factor for flagellar operon FliA
VARLNDAVCWADITRVTQTAHSIDSRTDALVRSHLPLVGYVVQEVSGRLPSHVDRGDLTAAGMSGLAEAAASFNDATGVPFHRFAAIRIKGAVLDELRSSDWSTRGARSRGRALHAAEEVLAQRLGRSPSQAEVASELGVSLTELDRRRSEVSRAVMSLDAFDAAVGQAIPDSAPDPAAQLVASERIGYLRSAVAELPERSRVVITGLFLQQRSITELATELGVTESRVSQLKTEALGLLHDALELTHGDTDQPGVVASSAQPAKGAAARRREEYYAAVAAHAAASGLGAQASLIRRTPGQGQKSTGSDERNSSVPQRISR